jgi:hypothetical protein
MSTCGSCGGEVKENAKFCKACGADLSATSALQDKKSRVMGNDSGWKKPVVIAVVAVIALAGLWLAKGIYMKQKMGNRPMFASMRDASVRVAKAAAVKSDAGEIRIPFASLSDGQAHFYAYAAGGKTITFFIMKAVDGTIKTSFDACMACNHAKLGYRQEGGLVVCNNCGMGFQPTDIGKETGGCNPIVVTKTVDGQMVVLKASDLEAGAQYF